MPYFDGTGPLGGGPMTGRGLGPCGTGFAWRRGGGYGRGFGRGFGWHYQDPWATDRYSYSQPSRKEETEILKDDAEALREELSAIEARIKELKEAK